jgi:integration host factor subunit alpha
MSKRWDTFIERQGFCAKQKAERRGRNPATGRDMMLAPRKVVTFKWSGMLKNKLNSKKPL